MFGKYSFGESYFAQSDGATQAISGTGAAQATPGTSDGIGFHPFAQWISPAQEAGLPHYFFLDRWRRFMQRRKDLKKEQEQRRARKKAIKAARALANQTALQLRAEIRISGCGQAEGRAGISQAKAKLVFRGTGKAEGSRLRTGRGRGSVIPPVGEEELLTFLTLLE